MNFQAKPTFSAAFALALLAVGCSSSTTEVDSKTNTDLQSGFSRPLNAEEKAKMGGATPAAAPDKTKG